MFMLNFLKQQGRLRPKMNFTQTRYKSRFKDGDYPTLNDMPIPEGDWKRDHDSKNTRYLMVLLSSIAAFAGAVSFIAIKGNMELNYKVPDYPYDDEGEETK